jgi:uncharacterized repeat protein (TIGR02543 family)
MRKKGENIMGMVKVLFGALFCLIFIMSCSDDNPPPQSDFTVTFNSHGGSQCNEITMPEGSEITLPLTMRNGYTFNGWYSAETGGEKHGEAGSRYTIVEDVTMHAQWMQNVVSFTVTFNSGGGSSHEPVIRARDSTTTTITITLPTPTRDGYIFNGWYSAAVGGIKYGDGGSSYDVTANVTMHAQWAHAIFFVTGDEVCADCSLPSIWYLVVEIGEVITLPRARLEDGSVFAGWFTSSTGGTRVGGAGDSYTVVSNMTLFAQWTEELPEFTVTFDANGGIVSPITQTVNSGTSITLPTPIRNHWTFVGWFTEQSGGTRVGGAGDSYTVNSTTILFAQWR